MGRSTYFGTDLIDTPGASCGICVMEKPTTPFLFVAFAITVFVALLGYFFLFLSAYGLLSPTERHPFFDSPYVKFFFEFVCQGIVATLIGIIFGLWNRATALTYKLLAAIICIVSPFFVAIVYIYGACIIFRACL